MGFSGARRTSLTTVAVCRLPRSVPTASPRWARPFRRCVTVRGRPPRRCSSTTPRWATGRPSRRSTTSSTQAADLLREIDAGRRRARGAAPGRRSAGRALRPRPAWPRAARRRGPEVTAGVRRPGVLLPARRGVAPDRDRPARRWRRPAPRGGGHGHPRETVRHRSCSAHGAAQQPSTAPPRPPPTSSTPQGRCSRAMPPTSARRSRRCATSASGRRPPGCASARPR